MAGAGPAVYQNEKHMKKLIAFTMIVCFIAMTVIQFVIQSFDCPSRYGISKARAPISIGSVTKGFPSPARTCIRTVC